MANFASNWRVVIRHIGQPDGPKITVAERLDQRAAQRIAKLFCGDGFALNRRFGIHTFGESICVVIEQPSFEESPI